jgi:hypothetical protein
MQVSRTEDIPIDVDLGGIDVADLLGNSDDNGEGFVEFEQGDVVDGEVGLLESLGEGDSGCFREVDGLSAGIGPC